MVFYRELELYYRLNEQIALMNQYARQLTSRNAPGRTGKGAPRQADPAAQEKLTQIEGTIEVLRTLQAKLRTYYTPIANNPKKYRTLTAQNLQELKIFYRTARETMTHTVNVLFPTEEAKAGDDARAFRTVDTYIDNDQKLLNKMDARDRLSLPVSAFKSFTEINAGQYNDPNVQSKWPGYFEYATLYLNNPRVSEEEVLRRYIQSTPQQIRKEYENRVSGDPRLYEYPVNRNAKIDAKIRNTGNVQKINEFLEADEAKQNEAEKLTFRERQMLIHHRDATIRINSINNNAKTSMDAGQEPGAKPGFLVNTENAVELDVHQPAFQTSANGCWSCAGAMMVTSRGIANVSQEEVRGYRPDIPDDELVIDNDELDDNYNYDREKAISDNADSILKYAPNSMMHTLEIQPFSTIYEGKGYTSQQYVRNAVELLKKQINHAIRVDRSPVGLYKPGHYITITGIEGDVVRYKESKKLKDHNGDPDRTFTARLEDLVSNSFFGGTRPQAIEINWLSDIKLARDEKTIHGVPSEYVYLKEDGTVTEQPPALREAVGNIGGEKLNRISMRVMRSGENEDQILFGDAGNDAFGSAGVHMAEKVYLPKELNVDYLKRMAANRSQEEEDKLKEADREVYHISEDKKDPEQAEQDMRRRIQEIQARGNGRQDNENEIIIENEFFDDDSNEINTDSVPKKKNDIPVIKNEDSSENEHRIEDIDTTSEETKERRRREREERDKERIRERIENINRPYIDDTNIIAGGGAKKSFTGAFNSYYKKSGSEKLKDRKKTMVSNMEKAKARDLKEAYPFSTIAAAAEVILEKLNQQKHFYLWGTNNAYKELIGQLEQVKRYAGKAADRDFYKTAYNGDEKGHSFTLEDAKKLVTAIDKASKLSKKYLSDKQGEMERDPLRRNDPGKMKYEQNRIDAVLDAYDIFSDIALSMRARENKTKDIIQMDEDRKETYNHFVRELVADAKDSERVQSARIKDRLYIPKKNRPVLNRIESLFGILPELPEEFEGVAGIKNLTRLEKGFAQIGGNASDRLSNKDFTALAIAASTTPDGLKDAWKNNDPRNRFTREEKMNYYAGQNLYNIIHADRQGLPEQLQSIQRCRSLAERAMNDYAGGNKDTLARLLANGIRNISAVTSTGRFAGDKNMELYASEMGLRMKNMLERDQDLMKRAMRFGLNAKQLKDIKNKGLEAVNGCIAGNRYSEGIKLNKDNWGIRTKERNYVDLLMNRYLEEHREACINEMRAKPEYKQKVRQIERRYKNELAVLSDKDQQYEDKKNAVEEAKKISLYSLKSKMLPDNPMLDELSNAGKETELRNRFREYIRGNGYTSYSPKDFIEKVAGTSKKSPTIRKSTLLVELGRYEGRKTEQRAVGPVKEEAINKPKGINLA